MHLSHLGKVRKDQTVKKIMPKQNLKTQEQVLKEFPDVFDEIGCLLGRYTINIDPKVQPVVHPPQRVPV